MAEVTKTKDRWENIIEAKNRGGRAVYRDGRKEMEIYDDRGNMVCVLDIDHIANIVEILDYIKQE